jgi:hypothetical protein
LVTSGIDTVADVIPTVRQQNGYGAFKRRERCLVCYPETGKVGVWRVTEREQVTFFCDDHVLRALRPPWAASPSSEGCPT